MCTCAVRSSFVGIYIPDLLQIRDVPAVAAEPEDTDNIKMSRMSAGKSIVESYRTAKQDLRLQGMHTYVHYHCMEQHNNTKCTSNKAASQTASDLAPLSLHT